MATRALIIDAGTTPARSIYTHWDGYPSHHGPILLGHYTTQEAVNRLMALGSLSLLAPRTEPDPNKAHTYETPQFGVCIAYMRDRGEHLEANHAQAVGADLLKHASDCWAEWLYRWDGSAWWFRPTHSKTDFLPLTPSAIAQAGD